MNIIKNIEKENLTNEFWKNTIKKNKIIHFRFKSNNIIMLNFFNFKKRLQYVIGVCISRKNKNFNTSIILCGTLLKTNFELTCFIYSPLIQKIEIYYNTNKINFNAILYKNRYYTKSKLYYLRAYSPKGLKKWIK